MLSSQVFHGVVGRLGIDTIVFSGAISLFPPLHFRVEVTKVGGVKIDSPPKTTGALKTMKCPRSLSASV